VPELHAPDFDVQGHLPGQVTIAHAAQLPVEEVLDQLKTGSAGLASGEAARRLAAVGPNAVRTHEASGWSVLARQVGSPILILLAVTAGGTPRTPL